MNIKPISVSAITQAVEARLLADAALADVRISRSEEINSLPSSCPWVGVYRADCQFPIRTLGMGAGFRGQRVQVVLLAQESDPASGAACEDRLNELVDKLIAAILSEPTLGGVVHTVDDFSVRYPDYRRVDDDIYMQTAMVQFSVITTVGGTQ